jgi:hypothetical protein
VKNKILFVFLLFTFYANSQYHYSYYNGYVEGFKKGCNCSNTPPNAKNAYNNLGTYDNGLKDGYIDGRIFLNNSKQSENSNFFEPNYDAIQKKLAEKQNLLNSRRASLDQKYKEIENIIIKIKNSRDSKNLTQSEGKIWNQFISDLTKYGNYDLTNDETFYGILKWMNEMKLYFLEW